MPRLTQWPRHHRPILALLLSLGAAAVSAEELKPTPEGVGALEPGDLHAAAQALWDEFAPESVKAEYELIGKEELAALFSRLSSAGSSEELADYADLEPQARTALTALATAPEFADLAEWLRGQLSNMEVARLASGQGEATAPPPPTREPASNPDSAPPSVATPVPLLDLWVERVKQNPRPKRAAELLPALRSAFSKEGVPEELVWIAEVESAFNPGARSPAGARGLFQLMPETAKSLGLSLLPFDQRVQAEKSAQAAAKHLAHLHRRFGDWPLALAAYNAGEGRVARTLKAASASDFPSIAAKLPAETRLYVPKVLATVQVRSGVAPASLAPAGK